MITAFFMGFVGNRTEPQTTAQQKQPEKSPRKSSSGLLTVQQNKEIAQLALHYAKAWQREEPHDPVAAREVQRLEVVIAKLQEFPSDTIIDTDFQRKHLQPLLKRKE